MMEEAKKFLQEDNEKEKLNKLMENKVISTLASRLIDNRKMLVDYTKICMKKISLREVIDLIFLK